VQSEWDRNGNYRGYASGRDAVAAHERVLIAAMRNSLIVKISLYAFAVILLAVISFLIIFAPAGRETAVLIVAVTLLIVAAACAGFATLRVKTAAIDVAAGEQDDAGAGAPRQRAWPDS
jgi:hypothetical protein